MVTTLAPITLPYLEKICFRSVARVSEDSRDTHRLRLTFAAEPLPPSVLPPAFVLSSPPAVVLAEAAVELVVLAGDAVVAFSPPDLDDAAVDDDDDDAVVLVAAPSVIYFAYPSKNIEQQHIERLFNKYTQSSRSHGDTR